MRFSKKKIISCEIGANFEYDDVLLSFTLIAFPFLFNLEKKYKSVNKWFSSYLGHKDEEKVFMVDSGRTALYLLLKSLNLPKGSEVLVQGFSCVVVPNAVLQAGYSPILCDVEERTYNIDLDKIEQKITRKSKVLIVQHSFGLNVDMQKAKYVAQKHNLVLIEDCAHSLGSKVFYNGGYVNVGSVGDASIFSLGRDKVLSSTIGGAVTINKKDKKWEDLLRVEYNKLTVLPTSKILKALYYPILTNAFVRPFYYFFNLGKFFLYISQRLSLVEGIYTKKEKIGTNEFEGEYKYPSRLSALLYKQLKKLKRYNKHRKDLAKIYSKKLNIDYGENNTFMRFPIKVSEEKYLKIKRKIRFEKQVLLGTWYDSLFLPKTARLKKYNYLGLGSLPVSEDLIDNKVLNLPTNIKTTKKDAEMIADFILKLK